jgi:hypothetical protein
LWRFVYVALARALAFRLVRGAGASVYVRAGFDDAVFGLSDIDLSLVVRDAGARRRALERWRRLYTRQPWLGELFHVAVYTEPVLRDAAASSTFTYDLDRAEPRATYLGAAPVFDESSLRERPRLYGSAQDWRLLSGVERRGPRADQPPQERRIAAWLELQAWWRHALDAVPDSTGPRKASLCVKLVAEPARVWLWLVHGERLARREDVLRRAIDALPEEETAFRDALALAQRLHREPAAPFAEFLPHLVRLSARVGDRLAEELSDAGTQRVTLLGADAPLASPTPDIAAAPLADWRAVVWPSLPDETFVALPGDPADRRVLAEALAREGDAYPVLRRNGLLVLPTPASQSELRAVQCRVTDPVTFALLDGASHAEFPNAPGWSAHDWAKRAVAEHRAWLRDRRDEAPATVREWPRGDGRRVPAQVRALAKLFTAARAILFLDSGAAELALTAAAVAELLGREEAFAEYAAARTSAGLVSPATVGSVRDRVLALYERAPVVAAR